MAKIRKDYITNPMFDPNIIKTSSAAAEGLCKWILAMDMYEAVIKVVGPKKIKLASAEADLKVMMDELDKKQSELKALEDKLLDLKTTFENMTEMGERLTAQVSVSVCITYLF